jgi:hypothetical protein
MACGPGCERKTLADLLQCTTSWHLMYPTNRMLAPDLEDRVDAWRARRANRRHHLHKADHT